MRSPSPLATFVALSVSLLPFVSGTSLFGGHDSKPQHRSLHGPRNAALSKRATGRITWYEAGLGACGEHNSGSEFIVALNTEQWDGGSHCYEMVTITHEGKTRRGQIVDQCMGCKWGEIDLSHGLFAEFGSPEILGTFQGQWFFDSESSQEETTTSKTSTTTTSPTSTPISTEYSTHSPTSTTTESTTSVSTTSAITSSSVSPSSSSSTSSAAAQETSAAIDYTQVINQLNLAYLQLGTLVLASYGSAS